MRGVISPPPSRARVKIFPFYVNITGNVRANVKIVFLDDACEDNTMESSETKLGQTRRSYQLPSGHAHGV